MSKHSTNPLPYAALLAATAACALVASRQPDGPAAPPVIRKATTPEAPPQDAAQPVLANKPRRVILITLDGWHVRLTDRMPVWQEMVAAGSWTLKAQVPRGTTTVISHAALYTGADPKVNGIVRELDKKLDGDPHVHGWRFRWKNPPLKVTETIFTATEAAGYKATAVVQKGKLVQLLRPNGDETGIFEKDDGGLIKTACAAAKDDDMRLVILHIGSPDGAGHVHGWLSEEQYRVAEQVSGQLQKLRKCLADAEAAGGVPTTLIVTSDHGGVPGTIGHDKQGDDTRFVPLAIIGPGIKPGYEIQASVRLVDIAPTILRILGIPASSISTLSGVEISEVFTAQ